LADYTAGTGTGNSGGDTQLRTSDPVGTLAVKYDHAGNSIESCTATPFGDGMICQGPGDVYTGETHFADALREAEGKLDHFGARDYNSDLGRFNVPDPSGLAYADPTNPQSLNLYSYALNNPLDLVDSSGLQVTDLGGGCVQSTTTATVDTSQYNGPAGSGSEVAATSHSDTTTQTLCTSSQTSRFNIPQAGQQSSYPGSAPSNIPTILREVCTGAAVAGGASAGALIGGEVGGVLGGLIGGGSGTLVAPGVGTIGGGIVGASAGSGIGAAVGGFIGGLASGAGSNVLCSTGGGSSFGGNQRENKQANDAKNEAERMTGKKFTRAQERVFHDEITGQGYGYHELIQIAVQVLQGVV